MAFDITRKRVNETANIELDEADGSPMVDDAGNRLSVTVCGPGSKTWRQADAEITRRQSVRAEKNPRKIASAIAEHRFDDDTYFLAAITVSFNGWEYPHPEGGQWPTKREMFAALYADYTLGHIRDKVKAETDGYGAFAGNVSKPSPSTHDNSDG